MSLSTFIGFDVNAASFDCSKAGTFIEHTICNDTKLSKLDEELAEAYKNAGKLADKKEQTAWLKSERNACQTAQCLHSAYEKRVQQLRNLSAGSNAASLNKYFIGKWVAGEDGNIEINKSSLDSFDFELDAVTSSGNTGEIKGKAFVSNKDGTQAVFKGENNCSVTFELRNKNIQVDQTEGCSYYGGMGVYFGGVYKQSKTVPLVVQARVIDAGKTQEQKNDQKPSGAAASILDYVDLYNVISNEAACFKEYDQVSFKFGNLHNGEGKCYLNISVYIKFPLGYKFNHSNVDHTTAFHDAFVSGVSKYGFKNPIESFCGAYPAGYGYVCVVNFKGMKLAFDVFTDHSHYSINLTKPVVK